MLRARLQGKLATGGWAEIGYHCAALGLRLGLLEDETACLDYVAAHLLDCFPNNPDAPRHARGWLPRLGMTTEHGQQEKEVGKRGNAGLFILSGQLRLHALDEFVDPREIRRAEMEALACHVGRSEERKLALKVWASLGQNNRRKGKTTGD